MYAYRVWATSLIWLVLASSSNIAPAGDLEPKHAFDTKHRQLWTANEIHGQPEPHDPYDVVDAFPKLKLHEPLSVSFLPTSNRFAVATRPGKIYTFENRPDVESAELLVDINRTTYGVVFHPRFDENGYFYTMSLMSGGATEENGSRISRFKATRLEGGLSPWKTNAADEEIVFEWPSGGHNGGCLRFGPDGYLYLSTGDGSGIADWLETGQKIDDVLGAILRIDVDRPSQGKLHSIPTDNPFVGVAGARPEIWSFGHRQVWRFSFDDRGRLWAGEVGQDLWEMIYLVERGGNYGWSVREGRHPFRPERPKGPGEFQEPIVEHPHSDFRSITGGYVFGSDRLPDVKGDYVYGDYDTGKLWSLRYEDGKLTRHRQLCDTQVRIVEFAKDGDGDVLLVDFATGGFYKIVPAKTEVASKPFPRKLSETGLFSSTADHWPAQGLIPYSVNAPLWSDGAEKERFIALPGDSQIEFDDVVYPHGPTYPDVAWRFPDNAVLVKTFSIEMKAGDPTSRKRLETRILQHRKMPGNDDEYGAQVWRGYTYIWNDEQTDAELAPAEGVDRTLSIIDESAPGGVREQSWRFPSRAECHLCHTMAAKYVLGATTLQMNKTHDYGNGAIENQIDVLTRLGVFKEKPAKPASELPQLADYRDEAADLHLRARAYLHANCAHCHRHWGGGNAEFELQASIPLTETKAVDASVGQGAFEIRDPKVIAPGDPARSMILKRMELSGLGRMPHIGSRVVDAHGVELVRKWLAGLSDKKLLSEPGAIRPKLAPAP